MQTKLIVAIVILIVVAILGAVLIATPSPPPSSSQTSDGSANDLVSFEGKVDVQDYSGPARLVLMKDKPSGLPEYEDSVEFDIITQ